MGSYFQHWWWINLSWISWSRFCGDWGITNVKHLKRGTYVRTATTTKKVKNISLYQGILNNGQLRSWSHTTQYALSSNPQKDRCSNSAIVACCLRWESLTQSPLHRPGMASLQSNSTFSFKHNLTGEARPACGAVLPFDSLSIHPNLVVLAVECEEWPMHSGAS